MHLASCPFHFNISGLGDLSSSISNLQFLSFLGYDKLEPYGFPIHGAIDGFSRGILWLEVTRSNNDPRVVAAHLKQVKELGGCPLLLVTDCGSENGVAASMQCMFRN